MKLPVMDPAADKLACKSAATDISTSRVGDAIARTEGFAGTGRVRATLEERPARRQMTSGESLVSALQPPIGSDVSQVHL